MPKPISRRNFLQLVSASSALLAGNTIKGHSSPVPKSNITVGGHLWVYASKYPPQWDCTPIIEQVFSDFSYAGIDGIELMHTNLFHNNAVDVIGSLASKYNLPVIGSSYGAPFWQKEKHHQIQEETGILFDKLRALKGKTFGISVGDAGRMKTDDELDAQADILKKVRQAGEQKGIESNLHNHTYEVINNMHDLRGTLSRLPDFPLGPDLNWLIRGGIDPVTFINQYKTQIVYLHIRDQYKDGEWSEAVGEGDTDFGPISKALQNVGFSGIATLELAFPGNFTPTRPIRDSWRMSRHFVKKTFGW